MLFDDDLSDPAGQCTAAVTSLPGCWGIGNTPGGSIAYAGGALEFNTNSSGAWMWSRRVVDSTNATMRIAGEFVPTSDGRFGLLCASGDANLYGALVGTDGSWAFVNTTGDVAAQVLLANNAAGLSVPIGESTAMAVECAGLATGSLRMTLFLGQTGPVAIYEATDGPDNFDRAATYAEAKSDGFSVDLRNAIAFGSRIADNQLTPAGQQLLIHVPADWQNACYQGLRPPLFGGTAETVLTCFIRSPGDDGAEIAEYSAYLSADAMNQAYQKGTDFFGTGAGVNSCADGSGEHGYHFGGEGSPEVGRLLCVDQFRGIRFDWTDTRLNILSTLVDLDGDYGLTYADWVAGGPNL